MWTRLFPPALPTPLHTEDVRRKNVRERLLDQDEDDACPPPLKKRAHYSIHPIFDKYNGRKSNECDLKIDRLRDPRHNRGSPSTAPESPMIEKLKHNYATLRVTLHSSAAKTVAGTEEALAIEMKEKVNANISLLNKVASRERELSASTLDCEVDTELTSKDGQKRTCIRQALGALSSYQETEAERTKQLTQLWDSWEKIQTDADELWNKFHELARREPRKGTSGISSNREWIDKEDFDIECRIKQVVEDMTACEDEFHEKLKDEETNILEAMLECSLG
ncbi:hypothetical protein E0Z10_g139 [Xylaria hypoxylon]|uniref:Uncharacterized protein n=1 Tax=Xylaria hypoxylon TaxID=37992 RepID=A0A4Z0Z8R8_9PEZI|nr:hypothetical protein E0Z10_g139 [Xylaria hypoxylon]